MNENNLTQATEDVVVNKTMQTDTDPSGTGLFYINQPLQSALDESTPTLAESMENISKSKGYNTFFFILSVLSMVGVSLTLVIAVIIALVATFTSPSIILAAVSLIYFLFWIALLAVNLYCLYVQVKMYNLNKDNMQKIENNPGAVTTSNYVKGVYWTDIAAIYPMTYLSALCLAFTIFGIPLAVVLILATKEKIKLDALINYYKLGNSNYSESQAMDNDYKVLKARTSYEKYTVWAIIVSVLTGIIACVLLIALSIQGASMLSNLDFSIGGKTNMTGKMEKSNSMDKSDSYSSY